MESKNALLHSALFALSTTARVKNALLHSALFALSTQRECKMHFCTLTAVMVQLAIVLSTNAFGTVGGGEAAPVPV